MLKRLKLYIRWVMTKILSIRPIQKKAVFISFGGKQYSADPRAISEKLHEMYPDFEIVWIIMAKYRAFVDIPDYVRVVNTGFGYMKELATTSAFITTNPLVASICKRKRQLFIQTWHGDRGMKKCLYEAWPEGKCPMKYFDDKYTDIAVAASDFGEDFYRKAFGYTGEISKVGMPRNDCLVNYSLAKDKSIRRKLGIPNDVKVLTYAPTFRDNNDGLQHIQIDILSTLKELETNGDKWICLLRAHTASHGFDVDKKIDAILDVSSYPDMADLLIITDMLITDYSSCAGDYVLRNKPVILALFDKKEYEENCRDLRVVIEDIGYIIAYNQEELNYLIRTTTADDYIDSCQRVLTYYCTTETGRSAEYICNRINDNYIGVI